MNGSVTFLMAIHCHQPIGNFDFVFENAYAKAYEPFLQILERHPRIHLTLHYSGCLLDWLLQHHRGFIDRLRALAARGQVELLSGGYYEPILPLIPEADRQGQLSLMRDALRQHVEVTPAGVWLAERVWEPELPKTLAAAGLRYTMLDANQFQVAKPLLPSEFQVQDARFWDLLGCYTTDYAGSQTILFPASNRLRYLMPFQPVSDTMAFLKRLSKRQPGVLTFADDGEKFGLWPRTHEWVYRRGWLERLFIAIEREHAWLRTATFQEHLSEADPDGRVTLPSGSYEEMLQWSGGHFRNFFLKYPEANAMQQKMLRISRAVGELKGELNAARTSVNGSNRKPERLRRERLVQDAERELYQGQCNCAYWHGVFGGLYLSHLRRAVYSHLIAAEEMIAQVRQTVTSIVEHDVDGDGQDECVLRTPRMSVIVDPSQGGVITEWSLHQTRMNLLDTLSRRYEPYHEHVKSRSLPVWAGRRHGHRRGSSPNRRNERHAPVNIHKLLGAKEANLASHLVYDDHRRSSFLDYGLQGLPTLLEVRRSTWGERCLWSAGRFGRRSVMSDGRDEGPLTISMVRALPHGEIRKTVCVGRTQPTLECIYEVSGCPVPVVALEFNLSLRDERYLTAGQQLDVSDFHIEEPQAGVLLHLSVQPSATLMYMPVETVSESEEGLERTYQGLALLCFWMLSGSPSWTCRLRWTVEERPASLRSARAGGAAGRLAAHRVRSTESHLPAFRLERLAEGSQAPAGETSFGAAPQAPCHERGAGQDTRPGSIEGRPAAGTPN